MIQLREDGGLDQDGGSVVSLVWRWQWQNTLMSMEERKGRIDDESKDFSLRNWKAWLVCRQQLRLG